MLLHGPPKRTVDKLLARHRKRSCAVLMKVGSTVRVHFGASCVNRTRSEERHARHHYLLMMRLTLPLRFRSHEWWLLTTPESKSEPCLSRWMASITDTNLTIIAATQTVRSKSTGIAALNVWTATGAPSKVLI